MASSRLLASPRSSTAVLRRLFATGAKGPVNRSPRKAAHERPPGWCPETDVKEATGADPTGHQSPVGDGSKRPELQHPVTGTAGGRAQAGRQEQGFVWKSATGGWGTTVSESPFVFAILPGGQNSAAAASEKVRVAGDSDGRGRSTVENAETDESTVVYHPGDEEYVNWGRIKPPGEPPDDEEQREAVHEMVKWKRVTQAALVIISVKALYDLTHLDEEIHHPYLDAPRPRYPYMRIRHKDFPWGPCDLLDLECWRELKKQDPEEVEALHNRRQRG